MQQEIIKSAIQAHFEQEVDFLQRLVRTRSVNRFTPNLSSPDVAVEQEIAFLILDHLQTLDLKADLYGVTPQRPNVICHLPENPGGKTLILTTHMDTVEPSNNYTCDPFGGEIVNGRLYGVGSADAKSQIAAFIYAVHALRRSGIRLQGNLTLAFVVDEESGACSPFGTKYLLEQGILRGDAALVGEPGDAKIATGHRGIYRFRVKTKGEAVHTGLREWEAGMRGHNAVIDMAHLIEAITDCSIPYQPSHTFPGRRSVLTFPTLIEGGNNVNMVPGWCEAYGDVRLLPGTSEETIKGIITACLDRAHVPYHLETVAYVPATEIPESAEIVQLLSASVEAVTGKKIRRSGGGPACDGWMFISRGIPAVCGYGVAYGGVHGNDEWADLVSLRQITEVYASTIVKYLGSEIGEDH